MPNQAFTVGSNVADGTSLDDHQIFRALKEGIGQHSTVLFFLRAFT